MCYHTTQKKSKEELAERFKVDLNDELDISGDLFNGFTFPKTPVISSKNKTKMELFQWGLIPNWSKEKSIQQYTLNAKIETLDEKPSFKNCIQQRCLILADGFMEWQWLDKKGKAKQQFHISLPNQDAFAFAGIWSEWVDNKTGEIIQTYSMVTTEANKLMSEIHNTKKRMPIILTPQNEQDWLSGKNYKDFANCDLDLKAVKINEILTLF
jgi:putative SOS response-associated peptidase YedK